MADPNIQKFEKEIEQKKLELKPIQEAFEKKSLEIEKIRNKLKAYRLEHGMFYPIEKLKEFAYDQCYIEGIELVTRTDGKLGTRWIFHEDEFVIYEDTGKFYFSESDYGVVKWDEDRNRYVHWRYHNLEEVWPEVIGFLEIRFNHPDKYDVVPPDVPYSTSPVEKQ